MGELVRTNIYVSLSTGEIVDLLVRRSVILQYGDLDDYKISSKGSNSLKIDFFNHFASSNDFFKYVFWVSRQILA